MLGFKSHAFSKTKVCNTHHQPFNWLAVTICVRNGLTQINEKESKTILIYWFLCFAKKKERNKDTFYMYIYTPVVCIPTHKRI